MKKEKIGKNTFYKDWWFWVILIIVVVLLIIFFYPKNCYKTKNPNINCNCLGFEKIIENPPLSSAPYSTICYGLCMCRNNEK
jgi:hypothetical protein